MAEQSEAALSLRRLSDYVHAAYYRGFPAQVDFEGSPCVRILGWDPFEYEDIKRTEPYIPEICGTIALHSLIVTGDIIYNEGEFIGVFEHESEMYGFSSLDPDLLCGIAEQVEAVAGVSLTVPS